MCGIAGIFSTEPIDGSRIRGMTDVQSHRGPDGEGHYSDLDGRLHLGHRRLSIIDLFESGSQPISDAEGRATIVFNGEIYNYRELRSELEGLGKIFDTSSDTEVLLNAWLQWGSDSLRKLRGMFAFAIWDHAGRKLVLARDPVGIKPLHYAVAEGAVAFSSELKGLTSFLGRTPGVHFTALGLYLRLGYVPAPHTIYRDCFKPLPGHWMEVDIAGGTPRIRTERYWDFHFASVPEITSESECIERVEAMLRESVGYHLVSDVPIGFFLSGGIDSSLVSYIGAGLVSEPVNTFSMGFQEAEYNELPFANEVAGKIGSNHHVEILTPESVELTVDRLVRMFDEPFADSSALPTDHVCRALGGKVKVALSGDGGDEVWGGYRRYAQALRHGEELAHASGSLKKNLAQALGRVNPFDLKRDALAYYGQSPIERYAYGMELFFKERALGQLLKPAFFPKTDAPDYLGGILGDTPRDGDILNTIQRLDILSYLPEDNLTKVDRTSMASSLEVRVPLLDTGVLDLASRVDGRLRVMPSGSNGHTAYSDRSLKHVLRRLADKYLGENIAYRDKKGFSVPIAAWFREPMLADGLRRRMYAISGSAEIFDTKYVEGLLNEHSAGQKNHSMRLWSLLVLFTWWETMNPEM